MKKILMLLTSSIVMFNPLFLTACNMFKHQQIYDEDKLTVANDIIDLDCNLPYDEDSQIELTSGYETEELVNKVWPNSLQSLLGNGSNVELANKLKKCSEKNIMKADKKAVNEFNEFTSYSNYTSYEEVSKAVYDATNAKVNFDNFIEDYVTINEIRQAQFKEIILRLYNRLLAIPSS